MTMLMASLVGLFRFSKTSTLISKEKATPTLIIVRVRSLKLVSTWCQPLPLLPTLVLICGHVVETDRDLIK
jgi:hypothetical protein